MNRAQRRAQAKQQRKNAGKHKINDLAVIHAISRFADVLIEHNPEQDYNSTDQMVYVVQTWMADSRNTLRGRYDDMMRIIQKFVEQYLDPHGVQAQSGVGAFLQDYQAELIDKGVPHKTRVMAGIIDLLSGHVVASDPRYHTVIDL